MEPKFFTVVVGALVQVLCPILIDAFCCRRHVSCSGYHEPDSLTMTTGKGSSSFTPTYHKLCGRARFGLCENVSSSRYTHRLYIVVVLLYYSITGSPVSLTAV